MTLHKVIVKIKEQHSFHSQGFRKLQFGAYPLLGLVSLSQRQGKLFTDLFKEPCATPQGRWAGEIYET